MASISNYLENQILNHVLGTTPYPQPTSVYVALFTTDPTDSGVGAEISGKGYLRQECPFSPSIAGQAISSSDIEFGEATAPWGVVTHLGIFDSLSGGNMLWHAPLNTSKAIEIDDSMKFKAGDIVCSIE